MAEKTLSVTAGRAQYIEGRKIKDNADEDQFSGRPRKAAGSKTENRLFIN